MDERKYLNARVELGNELRRKRGGKELTQSEVASRAGIHVNYYARIERGEENPSFEVLYAISKALEVKVAELFPF